MTHNSKLCTERPRKVGAWWANKHIAPDEKIESFELDFEGKRDRSNGYDPSSHALVIRRYEAMDDARTTYRREQQLKKLEGGASDEEEADGDDMRVDEAKVDESKQMDFVKVEKRVRMTGGGRTGTVRNLRIREDTTKYLLNLDVNSAHYDPRLGPRVRILSQTPIPMRSSAEVIIDTEIAAKLRSLSRLNIHVWEAFEKGQDIPAQAAPSQAELLYKNFKAIKEKLMSQTKCTTLEKYGNAAAEDNLPRELLLGQCEREVEYDRVGRIVKGHESPLPKSKYEEDVCLNNHTAVWGSWWKDHQWGYKCCGKSIRISRCSGTAGIEAAEVVTDLMKTNIVRKGTTTDIEKDSTVEELRQATWGADVPDDFVLDQGKLAEALKMEDERKREKRDERKRKYNVRWNN